MLEPAIYWLRTIPNIRLAMMPRPRGGEWLEDEISGLRDAGLDTIVSLIEGDESTELGLQQEAALCQAAGMEFISFPVPDRGVPRSDVDFRSLVHSITSKLRAGNSVAVHCRAGIGRSGLLAACILAALDISPEKAFSMLTRA